MHAFADLFCGLYDELDEDTTRRGWLDWEREDSWQSLKLAFRADVQSGNPVSRAVMRVDNGEDRQRLLLAALRGVDEAFRYVNPTMKGRDRTPLGLITLEAHVAARGRLDSEANPGALIPRLARRDQAAGEIDHKRDLFTYVQRVPPESWASCDVQVIGPSGALTARELRMGLTIACVPVIADPGELEFDVRVSETRRYYRIRPRSLPVTRERIGQIVAVLDRSEVMIAVAPELMLTPDLLACWQQALRARRGGRLRWVLAGSGDLRSGQRPSNTAVLLDGRTGALIGHQHKLYPFDMSPTVLERWGLRARLGDGPIAEDLVAEPRRLTIFDAGAARLAILICEDLNRPLDIGPLVRDFGISHLLVPVFGRPVNEHRWEQTAAAVHMRETGTTVIVSNSLVIATLLDSGDPGTSLVLTPGSGSAVFGRSPDPAEPVCFRVLPESAHVLK